MHGLLTGPNPQQVQKTAIYEDKTQHASFQGIPLYEVQNDT